MVMVVWNAGWWFRCGRKFFRARGCGLAAVTDAWGGGDTQGLGLCMAKYVGLPYTETLTTVHRDGLYYKPTLRWKLRTVKGIGYKRLILGRDVLISCYRF